MVTIDTPASVSHDAIGVRNGSEPSRDDLAGVLPVVMTPFAADWSIDRDALATEIDWIFASGADGLTVAMVSEINRLSFDERCALGAITVELARGRGPVVLSVGAESTITAVEYTRRALAGGAAAVMAAPPLLSSGALPIQQLRDYLGAIRSAAGELPLILQDASSYVGTPVAPEVQAALVGEFGADRLYLKPEAEPIGPTVSAILASSSGTARIFDGSGGMSLMDAHLRGVVGTMPGPDLTWAIRALVDALDREDEQFALAITRTLTAMMAMVPGLDGYVAFGKHLLVRQGVIPSDRMRGPVGFRLDPVTTRLIDAHADELLNLIGGER
ncbi:MAG: dihydrodipicolinate synthase family protein [Streptosporangiaceae bacterium]|nr:dihydrodipicolinate synthase family protein [Streptosporangiaceae bacterium]